METISGYEWAKIRHTQEIEQNIELRELLAELSVGFDGEKLIAVAREIAKSDKRVKEWQDNLLNRAGQLKSQTLAGM